MNTPEQPFKPLPIDDDTVFKLISSPEIGVYDTYPPNQYGREKTSIFNSETNSFGSTKDFVDNLAKYFIAKLYPKQLFKEGVKANVLEPGKKWVKGIIRLRLVVEFIPDETESNVTLDKFSSSLDDFRSKNL